MFGHDRKDRARLTACITAVFAVGVLAGFGVSQIAVAPEISVLKEEVKALRIDVKTASEDLRALEESCRAPAPKR
jgi:hypothetical protein